MCASWNSPWLSAFTRSSQPPALRLHRAPMCWCTTPARSHTGASSTTRSSYRAASTHQPWARLHDCEPFIKHADANEHQRVDVFTQSTLWDQSQPHGCVFNSWCFKTKSEFHHLFLLDCYAEISDRGQIYLSGRLAGALLRWTAGCLIIVNFSSGLRWGWECVRSPRATFSCSRRVAIGQEPKAQSLVLPPPPPELQPLWPLRLQAHSSESFCCCLYFTTHFSSHRKYCPWC